MKIRTWVMTCSALALSLGAAATLGQEDGDDGNDEDLEVTMTLLPEHVELPDAVTRELELPRNDEGEHIPSEQGVEHSAQGLETANAAREDGRAFGEAMAEAAQDNREEFGRGGRPDLEELLPDQVPDNPGPPDSLPGPPDSPPGGP